MVWEVEESYQALGGSGGFKLTVFRLELNCSYLHHNVKGVLVEQEHKSKEKLFAVSQRQKKNVAAGSSQRCRAASAGSEPWKGVWRYRSTSTWRRFNKQQDDGENWSKEPTEDKNVG